MTIANFDMAVRVDISPLVETKEAGVIDIPAVPFFDFVASNPATERKGGGVILLSWPMPIEIKKGYCKIGHLLIKEMEGDGLPSFPSASGPPIVVIRNLSDALKRIAYAASTESNRAALTGIYFDLKHGHLVATNGHMLHMIGVKRGALSAIVPPEVVKLIAAALPFDVAIKKVNGFISFENDLRYQEIIAKPIEGVYPDYQKVLLGVPANNRVSFTVNREKLLAIVEEVGGVAGKVVSGDKGKTFVLRQKNNRLNFFGSADYGEIHKSLTAKTSGGSASVSYNPAYLLSIIRALDDQENLTVNIGIKWTDGPTVIKTDSPYKDHVLLMPLRHDEPVPARKKEEEPKETGVY